MKEIIMISECWEKAEIGYVSTYVEINRATNEVISTKYYWDEKIDSKLTTPFNSFESLNTFINELVDVMKED